MALQTPRQRGLARPSHGTTSNTASSPSLRASTTEVNRKASYRTLNVDRHDPRTPSSSMDSENLEVGDTVDVPGNMYGTVMFIGGVRGKTGKFVGVELDREFAGRGKNSGDVDGTHYFTTSIPGAGIFLPVQRAEKRQSPSLSIDSFPATPNTPSYSTASGQALPQPRSTLKFSQSVGPGARPPSPSFKPKRPSLPRPESPLRKQAPSLAPTPGRALSASTRATPQPGVGGATTPSKGISKSTSSRPSTANSQPSRPYSRTGSRLGNRPDAVTEEERTPVGVGRNGSISSVPSFPPVVRSSSRLGSIGGQDREVLQLRAELAERDKRLAEQAAKLADMEASVNELSRLLPPDGRKQSVDSGDETTSQLRQMLREKNEKITILTSEFDAHRADFRSTLDSLEMASTETERVYEEQKRDLIAQLEESNARMAELEETNGSKKEFDDVARQLKQLEEFVQELEEGLEDARRGEAEARGEVEFLRGEVERGRSELKRERERAAAAVSSNVNSKELEQKDDEIRGLKAIIHSMSTSPGAGGKSNGFGKAADEVQRLQSALDESLVEKEGLERELERLRRDSAMTNGHHARKESEMTAIAPDVGTSRAHGDSVKATFAEHAARRISLERAAHEHAGTNGAAVAGLFCEMCESSEHDTLDCAQFKQNYDTSTEASNDVKDAEGEEPAVEKPEPLSLGKENSSSKHNNNNNGSAEVQREQVEAADDKWCALCEKDGHLAYECPDEQY